MNLRTEKSNWLDTLLHPRSYPPLEEDIACDVLIVGGGLSGLLAAYELTDRGIRVAVVDKRTLAGGTSAASAGLIQYASDKSLVSCMNSIGREQGVRFYRLCQEGVGKLRQICEALPLDPAFHFRDSLYYASCPEDVPALQEEFSALTRHGFPVDYLKEADIASRYSFRKPAALLYHGDAEANPFRLTHSLAEWAVSRGARIHEHTEIRHQQADEASTRLYTNLGKCITAQHALYATGYETQELKRNPNARILSSYVVATQPLEEFPGWPERCLIWETIRSCLYIRTTADNRIVAGGMDEATSNAEERDRMLPAKKDRLIAEVQKMFPNLPPLRAEYGWAAAFGETHDGLPMIGSQEDFPRCFFSMGYGGNGSLYSLIAARIIADLIEGKPNPDADLIEGKPNPDAELFRIDRPSKTPAMQGKG